MSAMWFVAGAWLGGFVIDLLHSAKELREDDGRLYDRARRNTPGTPEAVLRPMFYLGLALCSAAWPWFYGKAIIARLRGKL